MRLKIASRSSDLARIQAYNVARALISVDPSLIISFEFRTSLGDQNPDVPLASWGSKGVFTQDFFEDLKEGKYDMVVHSWKDLPTEDRPGTKIGATLERADVRDLLLVPKSLLQNENLTVLTSSPRRSYNLTGLQELIPPPVKKIEFKNVRGNVNTRIEKMFSENAGLIVAKAAIDRMLTAGESEFAEMRNKLRSRLNECAFMVLPLSINPPAAAQGALAVEIADGRPDLEKLLKKINDPDTYACVQEERAILKSYGGGCHQKIGVSVLPKKTLKLKTLRGLTDSGEVLNAHELLVEELPWPKAKTNKVFPLHESDNSWFERENIPFKNVTVDAYWVARADAWPKDHAFKGKAVWTSGLSSWKKLAKQGIWVNGCAENLGQEDPRIDALIGRQSKWVKLTHNSVLEVDPGMPTVATYKLTPKDAGMSPDLHGRTHFFWLSGTSFQRARELFPKEIEDGYHGCGPGLTHKFLCGQKLKNPPRVFLNLQAFLRAVT